MPEVIRTNPAGPEISILSGRRGGEPVGSIAIPVRDAVAAQTVMSLLMSNFQWLPKGKMVDYNIVQGGILTLQRNEAVQRMRGDWLLFIDDDMVFDANAIGSLIQTREEHDLDMLGALCFRRSPPHQPTLFMRENPTSGAYNFLERWDSDVIEVDATGMAFVVIHKRVFEKIAGTTMPSHEARAQIGLPNFFRWEGTYGEDLRFCQMAREAGARIWVDTRIEIGHVAERTIRHRDFLLELAQRDPDTVEERRKVNDEMGLPTVTPEEAMASLGLIPGPEETA